MERRSETEDHASAGPNAPEGEWGDASNSSPTDAPPSLPPLSAPTLEETHDRAGFWLRLIAFVIDVVILGTFSLLLFLGAVLTKVGGGVSDFAFDFDGPFSLFSLWISGMLTASAAYFTILHSEYGQTIGKSLLGLEVRTRDGALPSYSQALFRWFAYSASAFFFGLGFLWVALPPGKRGWHDLLAGTIVIVSSPRERET